MKNRARNLRGRLLLFTACTAVAMTAAAMTARAQTTVTPVVVPGEGAPSDLNAYQVKKIHIIYEKNLLREKDIPNAVTELTQKQVESANPTTGSIQTLLTQSPSVVAYTQQVGQNNPTLAIRGVSNDQLAETLDGVPINDLLNGSGNYLSSGQMGSPVTLNEIDGVTVYPGLAPPAKQGFGTTGGTIAYSTKQPTDDRYEELEGGIGSFDTQHFGFVVNTGKMGDSVDAPKALLLYDQSETAGYVDSTAAHYHDFMFNGVKPYDDGASHVGLVIIFNQANGLVQTLPTPTALLQAYGHSFNYPTSLGYYEQADQYLTTILSDETYINQYAKLSGSLFFLRNNTTVDNYLSAAGSNGYDYGGLGYAPNVQGIYNFFGCVAGSSALSYDPGPDDPTVANNCAAGEADNYSRSTENMEGITPVLTLFPDDYNTVVIGGMVAKTNTGSSDYIYGGPGGAAKVEIPGYNEFDRGAEQRTIYSAYAQDTIRLFDNKLQITPGIKVDSAYSSHIEEVRYGRIHNEKFENFTKVGGYYLGASYNLPDNFVVYGSTGKGALDAPVGDYSAGVTAAGAPTGGTQTLEPELVHLYEGGLRYDSPRLLLNVDYYYENISDGFAFFENFLTGSEYYANNGGELYRGVEGNGSFQITPNASLFGNFSYNEAEYTKSFFGFDTLAQDQFGYSNTGTPLSNVPIWNGLIGASYDYGPFSIYTTGQYTGREYTTLDVDSPPYGNTYYIGQTADGTLIQGNAAEPYGSPTPVPLAYTPNNPNGCTVSADACAAGQTVPASPYDGATETNQSILNPANFVWNILLTYKIPIKRCGLQSLTADLNMQNITDNKYYTYTYNSENPVQGIYDPHIPGGQTYNSAFVGEPRSFTFDLVAKF